MKKILAVTLCAMLLFALCACNPDSKEDTSSDVSSASGMNFNDGTGNPGDLPQIDVGSLGLE